MKCKNRTALKLLMLWNKRSSHIHFGILLTFSCCGWQSVTHDLSFVHQNLYIDLRTMTWLDSQLALLNILSNEIYCLSTVHVVIDFASESYVMAMHFFSKLWVLLRKCTPFFVILIAECMKYKLMVLRIMLNAGVHNKELMTISLFFLDYYYKFYCALLCITWW